MVGKNCGRIGSETKFSNPESEGSLSLECACHSGGHLKCYWQFRVTAMCQYAPSIE